MATPNAVKEDAPVPAAVVDAALAAFDPHDALRRAKRVKIRVHKTGHPNESEDIYVGVNGVRYQIKRGEVVEVPEPVMLNLKDAVRTVYKWVTDADGEMRQDPSYVQAYPFDLLQ